MARFEQIQESLAQPPTAPGPSATGQIPLSDQQLPRDRCGPVPLLSTVPLGAQEGAVCGVGGGGEARANTAQRMQRVRAFGETQSTEHLPPPRHHRLPLQTLRSKP